MQLEEAEMCWATSGPEPSHSKTVCRPSSSLNSIRHQEIPELDAADISWDWFVDGTFVQTTQHRIYTLVDAPKEPWGQLGSPPDFQLPWTEVLDARVRCGARAPGM